MISIKGTIFEAPFLWFCVAVMCFFMFFFLRDMLRRIFRPGKALGADWIKDGSPFVGSPCKNTGLCIQPQGIDFRVYSTAFSDLYILAFTFLLGPGVPLMIWLRPDNFHKDLPFPVYILLGMGVVLSTCLFLSRLSEFIWRRHYAEITPDLIRMCRGKDEEARIAMSDIQNIDIGVSSVLSGSVNLPPIENYTLKIHTKDGLTYALCITDKKEKADFLKSELERRHGGQ